jgi:hypothetical protein
MPVPPVHIPPEMRLTVLVGPHSVPSPPLSPTVLFTLANCIFYFASVGPTGARPLGVHDSLTSYVVAVLIPESTSFQEESLTVVLPQRPDLLGPHRWEFLDRS